TLVPVVTGRRSGHEVVHRLRRKWDLGHGLLESLGRVRAEVHELADLRGRPAAVLERLGRDFEPLAPHSVAALRDLVRTLEDFGVDLDRVALDLGFGRGIGFYSQMIFELVVPAPEGSVEVCGGGRYDGLARVLGSDRDDRGVGFAFGLERLLQVREARGRTPSPAARRGFLVAPLRPEARAHAIRLATRIRAGRARAVLEPWRTLDEATARAGALGLAWVVGVRGPLDDPGALTLRDAADRTEADSSLAHLDRLAREQAEGEGRR
ncbi:MAG: ATP phosphoribosyltransferase regulatory subunit, partial [Planctomycetaceae bacterium]|nr:ATP phosphoribosyltransferase regulatory subunit [Planctomycetaceae bacterium]